MVDTTGTFILGIFILIAVFLIYWLYNKLGFRTVLEEERETVRIMGKRVTASEKRKRKE